MRNEPSDDFVLTMLCRAYREEIAAGFNGNVKPPTECMDGVRRLVAAGLAAESPTHPGWFKPTQAGVDLLNAGARQ